MKMHKKFKNSYPTAFTIHSPCIQAFLNCVVHRDKKTTHLCRGNYQSDWAFEGSYALIAPTLFAKEKVDGFFLEYDDDRSGSFQPLEHIPNGGPKVVLGVFTSKNGELEDKEAIKARVAEAAKYVPLEQLCISPQCGFASTHHGNILTEEQQWDKLRYIVEVSEEIFGE